MLEVGGREIHPQILSFGVSFEHAYLRYGCGVISGVSLMYPVFIFSLLSCWPFLVFVWLRAFHFPSDDDWFSPEQKPDKCEREPQEEQATHKTTQMLHSADTFQTRAKKQQEMRTICDHVNKRETKHTQTRLILKHVTPSKTNVRSSETQWDKVRPREEVRPSETKGDRVSPSETNSHKLRLSETK